MFSKPHGTRSAYLPWPQGDHYEEFLANTINLENPWCLGGRRETVKTSGDVRLDRGTDSSAFSRQVTVVDELQNHNER